MGILRGPGQGAGADLSGDDSAAVAIFRYYNFTGENHVAYNPGIRRYLMGNDFNTQRWPLNEALKAPKLDAAVVVPFERLFQIAVTDDQRVEAAGMLAEALERAGLVERAATQWGACAELARKALQEMH